MARTSPSDLFTESDLLQLRSAGIPAEEAARQIDLLGRPTPMADLVRPCSPGDGTLRLTAGDTVELGERFSGAARAGRCSRFVPASGAATRMFKSLLHYRSQDGVTLEAIDRDAASGSGKAAETRSFLDNLDRFAFHRELEAVLAARGLRSPRLMESGDPVPILDALLGPEGLGYSGRPKALLAFHDDGGESRTPLEEHLEEAAAIVRDGRGAFRVHFTVSPEEEPLFRALLDRIGPEIRRRTGAAPEVTFSHQKRATDTLAVEPGGAPFRLEDGSLLLRPSGHGALLVNLHELGGDLVLIKNIDNVAPRRLHEETVSWSGILGGLALRLQERVFDLLERLAAGAPGAVADAAAFLEDQLSCAGARGGVTTLAEAVSLLDRPIRICGMVVNEGEPGGGPFWVRRPEGDLRLEIVEGAQIDSGSMDQKAILGASTHMNPVFMACTLQDRAGAPYDLHRFVDPTAVIVAEKSYGGRPLRALERPGLWNGAMSGWSTVFVEVPTAVFNPVKTIVDLLRPAHQPSP